MRSPARGGKKDACPASPRRRYAAPGNGNADESGKTRGRRTAGGEPVPIPIGSMATPIGTRGSASQIRRASPSLSGTGPCGRGPPRTLRRDRADAPGARRLPRYAAAEGATPASASAAGASAAAISSTRRWISPIPRRVRSMLSVPTETRMKPSHEGP